MFLAVALVCGLAPTTPNTTLGCTALSSKSLFTSEEACVEFTYITRELLVGTIPEGAYLSSLQCVSLEIGT